ncbi:DNA binding domain-containing protein, excisionase family [Saccharopolyspora antimicrobica]|uniref:DNA binding domain-containing protein, excisionase family n=1 Tax=Saccharopolyspora antimicrobica TaxID=455193 RepID=A0A1I5J3B8_9PSEU|nr:helix-turn-helix domain-containing protein [Saccharopolyspora antimicrobica]RKT82000.1 excisionase family DNA binding protein [Saccharopolyspora antimicrobica]SFO67374.1 DNA binding domain-containing protein, excisionase family [Saccharopolyspora antimicrobica]
MTEEMYSVEQVADLLGLHVRTVRGYIRGGRLNAVRIGKQYRIARSDLEAFTGQQAPVEVAGAASVEVSSIVQIDGVDRRSADRLGTLVLAGVNSARETSQPLRVQTVYDEERHRLKVVVLGSAGDTAEVLRLLEAVIEGGMHSGEGGNG